MNRSVLLVICDFFILTLLSFVKFDTQTPERGPVADQGRALAAPAMSNMVATLETALELEQQRRAALTNELASTSAQLVERLRALAEREQALNAAERRLSQSEIEARRLAEERARLEKAHGEASSNVRELQRAFETARESSGSLQSALTDSVREAASAKARLAMMEDELNRRRDEARSMQQQISKLDESQDRLKEEKFQLALELKETATEAKMVRATVTNLSQQLVQVGAEKSQLIHTAAQMATNVSSLTTNVSALAEKSAAIKEQIERQTRLTANTVYASFLTNRVKVESSGVTRGALGQEVARRKEGGTVLVRISGRVYAILHVDVTALRIWPPDAPWSALSADVVRGTARSRAAGYDLVRRDPRIVAIPVEDAAVAQMGARVYEVATDPAMFADAVVVGGEETYYGECAFRLGTEHTGYVQMERSTIRRLLGEFAPRRGDLAFTKTGQFLGVLVNGEQCLLLDKIDFLPALRCGEKLDVVANTTLLRVAQTILERLPSGLR